MQREGLTPRMDLFDWATKRDRTVSAPTPQNPCSTPADALPDEFHAVVDILHHHIGSRNAITALEIATAAELWPTCTPGTRARKIRSLIELHDNDLPFFVCGDSNGLYVAADADDVNHYFRNLTSRIRGIAAKHRARKRRALCDGFIYHGHGQWSDPESA
ncbi:MAG: hypothetical protein HN742_10845 [Lentisphaerae bacterium]|nr:hypothetical protein [Lentisphaerota bacterium]MBT7056703.1 hypothetical protein [Lentisphaerota bacterium]MBT7842361.1 hypothetical protein [Lentisphaerota bacterium]